MGHPADSDEEADYDGGDVDEEGLPGVGGFGGWMHIEYGEAAPSSGIG